MEELTEDALAVGLGDGGGVLFRFAEKKEQLTNHMWRTLGVLLVGTDLKREISNILHTNINSI